MHVETHVDWVELAACRDMDPTVFFPYDLNRGAINWERPKAICERCDVKGECLEFALKNIPHGDTGVWGGTTPDERQQIKRRRRDEKRRRRWL